MAASSHILEAINLELRELEAVAAARLRDLSEEEQLGLYPKIEAVREALERAANLEESVSVARPRQLTIQDQIRRLRRHVRSGATLAFEELLSKSPSRSELAVSLLAVLELIKRREVSAVQEELFGPIFIVGNPDAAAEGDEAYEEDLVLDDF